MERINLQPKVVIEAKTGFQIPIWVPILLGVMIVAGTVGGWWYQNSTISAFNAQNKELDFKLKNYQELHRQFKETTDDFEYLKAKRDYIHGISSNQAQWKYFFDLFKENMPKDVWVNHLLINRDGDFTLEGGTYSYSAIGHLIIRMEAMPQLSGVSLDTAMATSRGESTGGNVQAAMIKAYKIVGRAKLVPPPESAPPRPATPPGKRADYDTSGATGNLN
jgi:Tfp pilus assembly protein PilN